MNRPSLKQLPRKLTSLAGILTGRRPAPPARCLLLQWHITDRCNLRCTHCYQENHEGEDPSHAALREILAQYEELLAFQRSQIPRRRIGGCVTITGGEPFLHLDCWDLLETLAANRPRYRFAILTNGTRIDAAAARRLRQLRPAFVQVSIEGTEATHDAIRGRGNFRRTAEAARHLVKNRIRTLISFSAHQGNYREFPEVARLGRRLGVARVWADRVLPYGAGKNLEDRLLTPEQTREFFELMYAERLASRRRWFCHTEIAMHRALQFLATGAKPYRCTAGDALITVLPNGDLLPCRRMPIRVGNLFETPLRTLYYESDLFRELRDRNRVSAGCEGCPHATSCQGGLRCLSYALTGDPFAADPGCTLSSRKAEPSDLPRD